MENSLILIGCTDAEDRDDAGINIKIPSKSIRQLIKTPRLVGPSLLMKVQLDEGYDIVDLYF